MDHSDLILACTLDPDLVRERVDDWKQAVAEARAVDNLPGGARLRFAASHPADRLAALAQAEHECCPFFSFVVTVDGDGVTLDVAAPAEARPLVDILLGVEDEPHGPDQR